jgi:hypothetical protein
LAAFGTWLLFVLIAFPIRHHVASDALSVRTQVLPLGLGVLIVLTAGLLIARRPMQPVVAGVLLGLAAGWVSFTLLIALSGTPFGAGGMYGDCCRTAAAAERFSQHWASSDQFTRGEPSWYPPLWFWAWGRSAALFGKDAWQVGGIFQGVGLGFVVLVAGFAWRLVLSWPRAVAATAASAGALFGPYQFDACKGHEISATMLIVPAALFAHLVVVDVLAGRRRWLGAAGAGVFLGIVLLLYQIVVIFAVLGLLVLWIVTAARAKRLASLGVHIAVAAFAGFVAISWYAIPLIPRQLDNKYPRVRDLLMTYYGFSHPPGLFTGSLTITLSAIVGAVLVAIFIRRPIAQAMVTIAFTALVIQALGLLNVVKGGEDFYSYRSYYVLIILAVTSIVIFVDLSLWPVQISRFLAPWPSALRRAGAAFAVALLLFVVDGAWANWHAPITPLEALPAVYNKAVVNNQSARAYLTPLPSCAPVHGLPPDIDTAPCFPAAEIQACINRTYGNGAHPVLLAYDERLAGFYGDYYFMGDDGGASGPYDAWQQHYDYLQQDLAGSSTPADLLANSRHTPFGRIEGYVLSVQGNGDYRWVAQAYKAKLVVNFPPGLFKDPAWATCQARNAIVLLDRTAHPTHS